MEYAQKYIYKQTGELSSTDNILNMKLLNGKWALSRCIDHVRTVQNIIWHNLSTIICTIVMSLYAYVPKKRGKPGHMYLLNVPLICIGNTKL